MAYYQQLWLKTFQKAKTRILFSRHIINNFGRKHTKSHKSELFAPKLRYLYHFTFLLQFLQLRVTKERRVTLREEYWIKIWLFSQQCEPIPVCLIQNILFNDTCTPSLPTTKVLCVSTIYKIIGVLVLFVTNTWWQHIWSTILG